jgi:hypothetical protein
MIRTADITIERNNNGTPAYIKFNYKKYGTLLNSFFAAQGIDLPVENVPNEITVKALEKAKNYKRLKKYDSVEKLLADCLR